ncbi:hypothetical protein C8R44DRAFT_753173 [Mycena epipterygia]|nr:hypothetical protein C8R44DRAFT_753173 [Mycena epipterygia]
MDYELRRSRTLMGQQQRARARAEKHEHRSRHFPSASVQPPKLNGFLVLYESWSGGRACTTFYSANSRTGVGSVVVRALRPSSSSAPHDGSDQLHKSLCALPLPPPPVATHPGRAVRAVREDGEASSSEVEVGVLLANTDANTAKVGDDPALATCEPGGLQMTSRTMESDKSREVDAATLILPFPKAICSRSSSLFCVMNPL